MPSPNNDYPDYQYHTPKKGNLTEETRSLYEGWRSLGSGNIWFWIVPLMVVGSLIAVIRA